VRIWLAKGGEILVNYFGQQGRNKGSGDITFTDVACKCLTWITAANSSN
jgi:hypothetical protein